MTKISSIALFLAVLSALPVPGLGAEGPDAQISLRAGAVATGTGFSWGTGTLTFKGREHYFSVNGLSVGDFGGAPASGQVYHLKKIEDFDGNYTAERAGVLSRRARSAVTLKNEKGVRLRLNSGRRDTHIKIVEGGVEIRLK